ncbi:MAG: DHH family phosphoesterase [Candidatus Cloacimonetes bacterium]|nr:DHH family phosphoesterase [Candidatus Cloacimonadota bacterium]
MRFHWDWTPLPQQDPVEQLRLRRPLEEHSGGSSEDETLAGIDEAIDRIVCALQSKEPLIIYGDDDPDGICSTYILFDYLQKLGSQHHYYYIRNRLHEPHGLHPGFVEHVRQRGFKLVVTVDGGSSSFEGIARLNELGVDTIITDHHLLPDGLPDAYTMVNPQCEGTPAHLKHLAGAGVVWQLVQRMAEKLQVKPDPAYVIWAAIGTLADKVPLVGYNRTLCQEAIENLFVLADATLKHLFNALYVTCETTSRIHFMQQTYKLLSSGRADNGENIAMSFLLATKVEKGRYFRRLLSGKQIYDEQASRVVEYLRQHPPNPEDAYYLLHDEDDEIPQLLCSFAAAYMTGTQKIPALVIKHRRGVLVCEARSTDGLHLVDAFHACRDMMSDYGGHARAAGFTLLPGRLDEFKERFHRHVEAHRVQIIAHRRIEIDAEVQPKDINDDLLRELNRLKPFGNNNPEPVFIMRDVRGGIVREVFQTDKMLEQGTRYDIVFHLRGDDFLHILDYQEIQ